MAKFAKPIHIYIASNLWLPSESEGWAGFILEAELASGRITSRPAEYEYQHGTTPDGSRLRLIIEALSHLTVDGEIVIHMDDNRISGQWQQDYPKRWQKDNWKTSRGTEVKNRAMWEKILQMTAGDEVRILEDPGHRWVRAIQVEIRKRQRRDDGTN